MPIMKKRILILSLMAASMLGVFTMPTFLGHGMPIVSAEEEEIVNNDQQNPPVVGEELDEETIAEYSANISDEQLISYSEENLKTLVGLDLNGYNSEASADSAFVDDWYALHERAGAYVSTDATSVERDGRKLKGILDTSCENMKVRFTFTFDIINGLEAISAEEIVEEKPSLGESMTNAGVNTLLGMGTVFVMLIIMAYIISLMKYIPKLLAPRQKEPEVAVAAPTPVLESTMPTAIPEEDLTDDEELVAVISAAIAAYEGENNIDGFVVRSIRRK